MSHRIRLRRASVRPVLQTEPGTLLDLIRGLNSLQVTMEACRARSARDACQPASKTASRGPTHSPSYTGCWGRWFIAVSDEAPEFLTSQPTLPIYIFRKASVCSRSSPDRFVSREIYDVNHQARRTQRFSHCVTDGRFPIAPPVSDRQRWYCCCRKPAGSDDGCNFRAGERLDPFRPNERKPNHGYLHNQRRHADLLQRLGHRAAGGFQPRLAALRGCLRRPDVLSRFARISLHCA